MLGLVAQLVTLGALHGGKGLAQPEPVQEQGMGEVGWRAPRAPACTWRTTLLNGRSVLLLCVVYLVVTSMKDLALVASRVIR